jgi:hypothetical protein
MLSGLAALMKRLVKEPRLSKLHEIGGRFGETGPTFWLLHGDFSHVLFLDS